MSISRSKLIKKYIKTALQRKIIKCFEVGRYCEFAVSDPLIACLLEPKRCPKKPSSQKGAANAEDT